MLALSLVGLLLVVARVEAAPTDLDAGFGSSGTVTVPTCGFNGYNGVRVGLQAVGGDAGMLVIDGHLGSTSYPCISDVLARFTAGGQLDTSFGSNGYAVAPEANFQVASMVVAPDDSIYVLGWVPDPNPSNPNVIELVVAHYTTDGVLDATFGSGGVATLNLDADPSQLQLALQPDGGVIVTANGSPSCWYVIRATPSGSFDPAFGSNGIVTYIAPAATHGMGAGPSVVAVQSDDGIVIGGRYYDPSSSTPWITVLVRFGPTGEVDPTFGTDGILFNPLGASSAPSALVVGPDDSLTVAASSYDGTQISITRYDADGQTPDPSFNSGSIETFALPNNDVGSVGPMTLTADGLVGTGTTEEPSNSMEVPYTNPHPFLLGLIPDGTPDVGFGPNGLLFETADGNGTGIVAQPDGEFVQTGTASTGDYLTQFLGSGVASVPPTGSPTPSPTPRTPTTIRLPSNAFEIRRKSADKHGDVLLVLKVPGPGSLRTVVTRSLPGTRTLLKWGHSERAVERAGTTRVRMTPDRTDEALLGRNRKLGLGLTVRICVGFTPTAGYTATKCINLRVLAGHSHAAKP